MELEFKRVTNIIVSEEEYRAISKTLDIVRNMLHKLDIMDTDSITLNSVEWSDADLDTVCEFLYGLGEEVGFED